MRKEVREKRKEKSNPFLLYLFSFLSIRLETE